MSRSGRTQSISRFDCLVKYLTRLYQTGTMHVLDGTRHKFEQFLTFPMRLTALTARQSRLSL